MTLDELLRELIREEITKALIEQHANLTIAPQPEPMTSTTLPPGVPHPNVSGSPVPPGAPPQVAPFTPPQPTAPAAPAPGISLDDIKALANDFHRKYPQRAAEVVAILAQENALKMDDIPVVSYSRVFDAIQKLAEIH